MALAEKSIAGSGEDTLLGHAKDFAVLLETSDPFIQRVELIVGSCLAVPLDGSELKLGYYDWHFPPGHQTILRVGLAGLRDTARENPDVPHYRTLIVRVWGFSAVFVELSPALQEHLLARIEYTLGP
jgi:hypothetical protein